MKIKYMVLPLEDDKLLFSLSTNIEDINSIYDDLTKCYKKELLYEKINESINNKKEFALMKIDIDYFKEFNQKYGHMFGDMILIDIAGILKTIIANNGFVARSGGDEFLLLIYTSNDYDTVHKLCSDIRFKISNLDGSNCVKNAKFTATVGCALYPLNGDNSAILLKKVDSALLRGKNKNRNCFIMYTKEKCGEVTLDDNNPIKEKNMDTYD